MYPIRPIGSGPDDAIKAIDQIPHARIRRETEDEASERRRREQREREQQRHQAAVPDKPVPAPPDPVITPADEAPDGHPHCDVRV